MPPQKQSILSTQYLWRRVSLQSVVFLYSIDNGNYIWVHQYILSQRDGNNVCEARTLKLFPIYFHKTSSKSAQKIIFLGLKLFQLCVSVCVSILVYKVLQKEKKKRKPSAFYLKGKEIFPLKYKIQLVFVYNIGLKQRSYKHVDIYRRVMFYENNLRKNRTKGLNYI